MNDKVFEIREIPRDTQSLAAVFDVCAASFDGVSMSKLKSNWFDSSPDSTFFGAYAGDDLAAVNGFLSHNILLGGVQRRAFQSCWSATSLDYRGKGLFSRIINHAKEALKGRAAFIFGFPNHLSGPIFVNKLGFREVGMSRVLFATRGPKSVLQMQLATGRYLDLLDSPSLVKFDQSENARWKKSEHGQQFIEVEHNTNFIWGTVARRRIGGVPLSVLLVGGCELNKPRLLPELLRAVGRARGVSIARMVCTRDSLLSASSRIVLAGERTEPFIHFPVDVATDGLQFDAFTGLKDVF